MADREAIDELYARFNHAFDHSEVDRWLECFTEDATFATGKPLEGREAIRRFAEKGIEKRAETGQRLRHWVSNLILDGSGDERTGRCYFMVLELDPAAILLTGLYDDKLVRSGDGWCFASRVATFD